MTLKPISDVASAEEARSIAIDWQQAASTAALDWEEISKFEEYFAALATKFELTEEFKENGII